MTRSRIALEGLPHSEISGSKPVCGSPELIAAYHVLHRRPAPRHPPYALSSLTTTFALHETWVVELIDVPTTTKKLEDLRLSMSRGRYVRRWLDATGRPFASCERPTAGVLLKCDLVRPGVVELTGFEPVASWLQTRRSTN